MAFTFYTNDTESFLDIIMLIDDISGNKLGLAMIIIVGFVTFLSMSNYSADRALGATSLVLLMVSIFLRFLNLINDSLFYITIIIYIGAIIWMIKERSDERGM